MTLQEQVEQFIEKNYTFARDDLPDDTYALLRAFVEECCEAICDDCGSGIEIVDPKKLSSRWNKDILWHGPHESRRSCRANNIRNRFKWLP